MHVDPVEIGKLYVISNDSEEHFPIHLFGCSRLIINGFQSQIRISYRLICGLVPELLFHWAAEFEREDQVENMCGMSLSSKMRGYRRLRYVIRRASALLGLSREMIVR